ncbi:cytochrome P450 3A9-like [Platysternon megacephalum]|uniref:Cytochrome P450 3A9-like n=1 Tax=Platysternon megacephalum TaxID=55544 RepID=A0A4D9EPJ4_9SAUR|nr:cytochrome P450 3A9-like [Platysternon megacephalum]
MNEPSQSLLDAALLEIGLQLLFWEFKPVQHFLFPALSPALTHHLKKMYAKNTGGGRCQGSRMATGMSELRNRFGRATWEQQSREGSVVFCTILPKYNTQWRRLG